VTWFSRTKLPSLTGADSGHRQGDRTKLFVREGARVVIADWNNQKGSRCGPRRNWATTRKAFGVVMELTMSMAGGAGDARKVEQFGKIDRALSNAGIQIVARSMSSSSQTGNCYLSIHLDGAVSHHTPPSMQRTVPTGHRRAQHHLYGSVALEGSESS